jgi:hypothetical protein
LLMKLEELTNLRKNTTYNFKILETGINYSLFSFL